MEVDVVYNLVLAKVPAAKEGATAFRPEESTIESLPRMHSMKQ
jgi:hypothetical protein